MNDDLRMKTGKQVLDTACSMLDTIEQAGGRIPLSKLRNMTVEEFMIKVAATNGIRFKFEKQE